MNIVYRQESYLEREGFCRIRLPRKAAVAQRLVDYLLAQDGSVWRIVSYQTGVIDNSAVSQVRPFVGMRE